MLLNKEAYASLFSKGAQGFFKIGVILKKKIFTYLAAGLTRGIFHCSAWTS